MRFSASMLKLYESCSLKAKFHYIDGLREPQSAHASFGNCVHDALDWYHRTRDVDSAVERFKDTWADPDILGVKPEVWQYGASYGGFREKGIAAIKLYDEKFKWDKITPIASEHAFYVPMGEHFISGAVDFLHVMKTGKGETVLTIVDVKSGKAPTKWDLAFNIQFCADEQTEILTKEGWKTYDQVYEGEEVLTLNQKTLESEWQPAKAVNVFNAINQDMLSMEGKAHSSLTTLNHRWPVKHLVQTKDNVRYEQRVRLSEELSGNDRIYCAAPTANLPEEATISDEMVELVGWWWTEGHVVNGGSISFAQSEGVYPKNVDRIRCCLTRLFGPASVSMRNGRQSLGYSTWREAKDPDTNRFYLNRDASKEVLKNFVNDPKLKLVSPKFINSLTYPQLKLFTDISIMADGHIGPDGRTTIYQSEFTEARRSSGKSISKHKK